MYVYIYIYMYLNVQFESDLYYAISPRWLGQYRSSSGR